MQRETHQSQELLERKDVVPIEIEEGIDLVDAQDIAQNLDQNSRKVVDPEINEILARQPLATKMIAIAEEQNLYFKDNSRKHKEMLQIFSGGIRKLLKTLGYEFNVSLETLKTELTNVVKANIAYTAAMLWAGLLLQSIEEPTIILTNNNSDSDNEKLNFYIRDLANKNKNNMEYEYIKKLLDKIFLLLNSKISGQQTVANFNDAKRDREVPLWAYAITGRMPGGKGSVKLQWGSEKLGCSYFPINNGQYHQNIQVDKNVIGMDTESLCHKKLLKYQKGLVIEMMQEIYRSLCTEEQWENQQIMPDVNYFGMGDGGTTKTFISDYARGNRLFIYPEGPDKTTHSYNCTLESNNKDGYISILPQGYDGWGGEVMIDVAGIILKANYKKETKEKEAKLYREKNSMRSEVVIKNNKKTYLLKDDVTGIEIETNTNTIKIPSKHNGKNINIIMKSGAGLEKDKYDEIAFGIVTENTTYLDNDEFIVQASSTEDKEKTKDNSTENIQENTENNIKKTKEIVAPVNGGELEKIDSGNTYKAGWYQEKNLLQQIKKVKKYAYDMNVIKDVLNCFVEVSIDNLQFQDPDKSKQEYENTIKKLKGEEKDGQLLFPDKAYEWIHTQAEKQVENITDKNKEPQRMLLELRCMWVFYELAKDQKFNLSWNEEKTCYNLSLKESKDDMGIFLPTHTIQIFPKLSYIPKEGKREYSFTIQNEIPPKIEKELTK